MFTNEITVARRLLTPKAAVWLAAFFLQGCAVVTAPGFDYTDPKLRTSVTLGQYVPTDADNPPQGVVTPITPALVQAQFQSKTKVVAPDVLRLFADAKPYTIGPSDVIGIVVYDHPELLPLSGAVISQSTDPTGISSAPGFIVGADGRVSFPYIGQIKVEGMTENEAARAFEDQLKKVFTKPQVTVRIQSFRSRRAYIEGEVRTPGTQIFTDVAMTLMEGINRAGGITAAGDRSAVTLTRSNQTVNINLMLMQDAGLNPNRILLQSGDLVTVKNRDESKVFVMGEISRPSALPMRNGRLSLNEALGEAGGPNLNTANTAQIYVIRNNAEGSPVVFHLNAASPTALALAESFALRPRDVVYLDPVPLVSWNRIISLLLPTTQTLSVGKQLIGQ